ncbi:MAG: TonB-dependent receptor plug domain-containing protein [Flavobacteriales bacterium]|nr:TonB-dependent receptor plug domain-containing protein [Flavobacteriales bacterium]
MQLVPGLFVAQHAGGGKAEQIFFRGFDIDHGTDLQISVDGLPVNMVSHAHGQGYADLHFTIPETMDKLLVHKGPYDARFGDFATSGTVEFLTRNSIDRNEIKAEYGMFNTVRAVGLFNLLDKKHLFGNRKENAYIAAEYVFTDAYFQSKQDFGRFNIFGKYNGQIGERTLLTLSASTFSAAWNASGQVPERAIASGRIDRFGAIDDNEGGETSRTNAYSTLSTGLRNGGLIKNQLYFVKYDFNLYSNFTFFAADSVNGDMIAQTDDRTIMGYTGSYGRNTSVGSLPFRFNTGIGPLRPSRHQFEERR